MLYATTLAALWKCPCFEFQVYHWNPCDPEVSLFKKHLLFSAEKNVCGTCSIYYLLLERECLLETAYLSPWGRDNFCVQSTDPDLTFGIALVRHWCEMKLICPFLKTIARKAYWCNNALIELGSDSAQNLYKVNGTVFKVIAEPTKWTFDWTQLVFEYS